MQVRDHVYMFLCATFRILDWRWVDAMVLHTWLAPLLMHDNQQLNWRRHLQIFLRLPDGRTRVLRMQQSDTVDQLQGIVRELEGMQQPSGIMDATLTNEQMLSSPADDGMEELTQYVSAVTGVPHEEQRLMCGHQQLLRGAPLAACGLHDQSNVSLLLRLRGGAGASKLQLTVQPRVQKEKWSLYWKESMSTKTLSLDPVQLDVDANTTIAEVASAHAHYRGWL
jgi:Ubiquitin family